MYYFHEVTSPTLVTVKCNFIVAISKLGQSSFLKAAMGGLRTKQLYLDEFLIIFMVNTMRQIATPQLVKLVT